VLWGEREGTRNVSIPFTFEIRNPGYFVMDWFHMMLTGVAGGKVLSVV